MDCALIQPELLPYHFAATTPEERERIDAHLLACTDCLRTYLDLKHHMERGVSASARPSPAVREKLRLAIAAEFRPAVHQRVRRWLKRPIPLYQGLFAAAVALVVASLAPALAGHGQAGRGLAAPGKRVDSSRMLAESLAFY
jgi:hypothetical protein